MPINFKTPLATNEAVFVVRHEKSGADMLTDTKTKCLGWIKQQPDWEQYLLVDYVTGDLVPFTLSR